MKFYLVFLILIIQIAGFEFCKIDLNGNNNIKMDDGNVGFGEYQAPEILLRQQYYDEKVDVFSMGVVLFILLTGYPPFKFAKESDKWYQFIVKKKYRSFWNFHRKCGLRQQETDLITRMIVFNPQKRISIDKIRKHSWFTNKDVLKTNALIKVIRYRHTKFEINRNNDPFRQSQILFHSSRCPCCLRHGLEEEMKENGLSSKTKPPSLSDQEAVGPYCFYTSNRYTAMQTLFELERLIKNELKAKIFKPNNGILCTIDQDVDSNPSETGTHIDILNFSLLFECWAQDLSSSTTNCIVINMEMRYDNIVECNILMFKRIKGNRSTFECIVEEICRRAGEYLTGLARKHSTKILHDLESDELNEMYSKCFAVHEMTK